MTFLEKLKYAPIYLLSLLPLRILYVFADILYFLMYRVIKYRRDVVRNNLKLAFPELRQDELINIEKKFYHHFCDLISESIKAMTINYKHLMQRFKLLNPELVEKLNFENKSILLYAGHFGNWEWLTALPLIIKPKVLTFYLPLSNIYFNELIKKIRGRFGAESIEAGRGYKALLNYSAARINTFTLFLADQSPHKDTRIHWTSFFNQDTAFNVGINVIAQKMNQVVLFPNYRQIKRGYYEIELITIWDGNSPLKENEIIERFAIKLEAAIKESPHLWLWTHRRWKLKKIDH